MTAGNNLGVSLVQADLLRRAGSEEDPDPHWVTTRYDILIDTRRDVWFVDGRKPANVGSVRKIVGPDLSSGLEAVFRYYARTQAPNTLVSLISALLHYQRTIFPGGAITRWSIKDLRSYRARLMDEFGHEVYLVRLRSFIKRWYEQGHPGTDQTLHHALRDMRLEQPRAGRAVRRMDPKTGPLTEQEQADLDSDVFAGAESGEVALEDFAQYLLQNARTGTGRRPDQLAKLKCRDVDPSRVVKAGDASDTSAIGHQLIRVPRTKQRGADWRQNFRDVVLPSSMFAIVHAQRLSVEFRFEEILGRMKLDPPAHVLEEMKPNLPLFPDWALLEGGLDQASSLEDRHHRWTLLRQHAKGREWHPTFQTITTRLQAVVKRLGTLSRSGSPLAINSQRLRRSKGSNLARDGASLGTIAWLLDHSTTNTVVVYVENLPEHAAAINERLKGSSRMQLVARMFRGELVDSEAQAKGGGNPRASRILWRGEGAASCGTDRSCGMGEGIPLACYTCNNFQPWLDGPHEAVLASLRRDRAEEAQVLGDNSPVVKRRDMTIAAVTDVIDRCERRREELAKLQDVQEIAA